MNIRDFAAKPFDLELLNPTTKEGLGVTITIVGKNSRQFKDKFYEVVDRAQQAGQDKKTQAEKLKAAEEQSAELIANCIIGWSDDEFFGGEYTFERAYELVNDPTLSWVREQIDAAIVEESHFFPQKPTT